MRMCGQLPLGDLVCGAVPDLPVEVPPDCTRWKIRARPDSFARIYLKRGDRVEQWILVQKDGKLQPGIQQAENRRSADRTTSLVTIRIDRPDPIPAQVIAVEIVENDSAVPTSKLYKPLIRDLFALAEETTLKLIKLDHDRSAS